MKDVSTELLNIFTESRTDEAPQQRQMLLLLPAAVIFISTYIITSL